MAHQLLNETECRSALTDLPGWALAADGKSIAKSFVFKDFNAAFAFMTKVAAQAEALKHHPDWTNIYNKVSIRLNTHDAGGVTGMDIALAKAIEKLVAST